MKERQIYMKRTGKRMLAILLSMVLLLSGGTSVPLLAASGAGNTNVESIIDVEAIVAQGMEAIRVAAAPIAGEGKFLAAIEAPLADSIPITTATKLDSIRDDPSKNYHLANNIDLSDWGNWDPIGDSESNAFSGVFDGQGYVIYGLTVTGDIPNAGLFGVVKDAFIENVGMEDGEVDVSASKYSAYEGSEYYVSYGSTSRAGGVVCSAAGTTIITNCYNANNVSSPNDTGGVVGYGSVTI
jgi:hypothetical protein